MEDQGYSKAAALLGLGKRASTVGAVTVIITKLNVQLCVPGITIGALLFNFI